MAISGDPHISAGPDQNRGKWNAALKLARQHFVATGIEGDRINAISIAKRIPSTLAHKCLGSDI